MRKKFIGIASLAMVSALSAGLAVANVRANAADALADFAITATSVRFDDPEKDGVDSGLRFMVEVPENVKKADVTNAFTRISFTTADKAYTTDVEATVWRTDGSGWNTVLLDIPESDYITEVTAQAFMTVNDKEWETQAQTSSIAKTASIVMNANNALDDRLTAYVAGVTSVVIDQDAQTVNVGESVDLSATTAPEGYSVVWASDNTDVATVDKDGVVTTKKAGTANITAKMGSVVSEACVVTAAYKEAYDFEDGKAVNFIYPSYSADKTVSVVDYNGSKAMKMSATEGEKNLAFEINADYLHTMFADSDVNGVSFDFTMAFEISGDASTQTKLDFDGRVFDWKKYQLFDSHETQKINISRAVYDAWVADADAPFNTFRMVLTNRTWALEWYIDNLQVTKAADDPVITAKAYLFNTGYGGTGYENGTENPTNSAGQNYHAYDGNNTIRLAIGAGKQLSAPVFRKGTNANQLQTIFADVSVGGYSFYMFNPNSHDIYVGFEAPGSYSSANFDFAKEAAIATKLQPKQWTEVTLTRAKFNEKAIASSNNLLCLMLFVDSQNVQTGLTYVSMDGFHKETATQDYGEQLVSLGAAYGATVAINTNTDYINEGKTSISLTTSRDSNFGFAIRGALWKHLTKGDWESISFDIYVSKPYTYQIGWVDKVTEADYPNHWGTFTVGWNTITITKEMYTAIADAYAGYNDTTAAMDFKFLNGGLATGDVAYIDNFRTNYS